MTNTVIIFCYSDYSGKEGIYWYFLFLRPSVYHATNAFQIIHFLFVSSINALNHIINFLLPSLVRSVQRNIGHPSFCAKLALRARSVQKRLRSDISLYRPRVLLYNKRSLDIRCACLLITGVGKNFAWLNSLIITHAGFNNY